MKIVAILGVKDELDLLPHCMSQLRAIGVERIDAIDAGSTDGSLEWLEAHRADGDLGLHRFSDQDPDAQGWARLNVAIARDSGADRVIFLDADEFWIPASGRLRDCASLRDNDVLTVHRYNVPLSTQGGLMTPDHAPPRAAQGLWLVTQPVEDFRERLDAGAGLPWIRGVPVPKVAARPGCIGNMHDGGHAVDGIGDGLRRGVADDLLIAHVPFTTAERFARKVANIRRVFEVHDGYFGEHLAWHWRRWLALDTPEAVAAEFRHQCFDDQQFATLRAAGVLHTAEEMFRHWRGDDVPGGPGLAARTTP